MPAARVTVEYVIVCPDDESQHAWKMPTGWDEEITLATTNDHREKGFYIRLPGASRNFLQIL